MAFTLQNGLYLWDAPPLSGGGGDHIDFNFRELQSRTRGLNSILPRIDASDTSFGTLGAGDDSSVVQAIVDAVIALNRPASIWLPPHLIYDWTDTVTIESYYPISIYSDMQCPNILEIGLADTFQNMSGYIRPVDDLPNGFFKWVRPAGSTQFEMGGSFARGLCFLDDSAGSGANAPGGFSVHSCLNFQDNFLGGAERIFIFRIKGTGIYCSNAQVELKTIHGRYNGDTSKPFLWLDTTTESFAHVDRLQVEQQYSAPSVQCDSGTGILMTDGSFEAETTIAAQKQKFIAGAGSKVLRHCYFGRNDGQSVEMAADNDEMSDCTFDAGANSDLTEPFFTWSGSYGRIMGVTCRNAPNQVAYACTVSGSWNQIIGLSLKGCGNANLTGERNSIIGPILYFPITTETYALEMGQLSRVIGGNVTQPITHGIHLNTACAGVGNIVEVNTANKHGIVQENASIEVGNIATGASGTGKNFSRVDGAGWGFSHDNYQTYGSATVDPGSVAAGATATGTISATGAELGRMVVVAPGVDTAGLVITAQCSASGTIKYTIYNPTAGAIDLASSTWFYRIFR